MESKSSGLSKYKQGENGSKNQGFKILKSEISNNNKKRNLKEKNFENSDILPINEEDENKNLETIESHHSESQQQELKLSKVSNLENTEHPMKNQQIGQGLAKKEDLPDKIPHIPIIKIE